MRAKWGESENMQGEAKQTLARKPHDFAERRKHRTLIGAD